MQINEQNVQQVIQGSMSKAVFLYFYTPSPDCDPITQMLQGAISDTNEYLTLALADVREPIGQSIAMQLGLSGVPALAVLVKGRPAEILQGDEIKTKLKDLMQKYMPKEEQLLLNAAKEAAAKGDLNTALTKAAAAYKLNTQAEYAFTLASLYLKTHNPARAEQILNKVSKVEQELQAYKDLISALNLAKSSQDSPEIKELQAQHEAKPQDQEIAKKLAAAWCAAGEQQKALEMLFAMLKQDLSQAEIKKTFIDILNTMAGDPLQGQYRRKLYTLMY